MVVQCEQCRTRFRLDDSKVGDKGVKVRCSKCRHIFLVRPERVETPEEPDFDALFTGLAPSTALPSGETTTDITEGTDDRLSAESAAVGPEPSDAQSLSGDSAPVVDDGASAAVSEDSPISFHSDEYPGTAENDSITDPFKDMPGPYTPEFTWTETASSGQIASDTQAVPDSVGDAEVEAFRGAGGEGWTDISPSVDEEWALPGYSTDQMGSLQVSMDGPDVTATDLSDGKDASDAATSTVNPEEPSTASTPTSVTPVTLESGVQGGEGAIESRVQTELAADEPPLMISSRRKSSSLFPLVTAVVSVIIIVVLAGFGFYLIKEGPAAFNRMGLVFIADWAGVPVPQDGGIILKGTKSEFLKNNEGGEIFVVRGEAFNGYKVPRAAVQVKVTVFGAKGEAISTKTVYCGNPLTNEQLASLPMVKIEAAMNNRFGDSLSNLGLQPAKSIPFVVVIAGIPKDASDFGLEVAGSTAVNP